MDGAVGVVLAAETVIKDFEDDERVEVRMFVLLSLQFRHGKARLILLRNQES